METPTTGSGDARLMARLRELLRDAPPIAREIVNHNSPKGNHRFFHDALLGKPTPPNITVEVARLRMQHDIDLLQAARQWPAPPTIRIARRSESIRIDGRLEAPAWRSATPIPLIYQANCVRSLRPLHAQARVLWDEDFLYAGYEVQDWPIHADRIPRDAPAFIHDAAEIFLLPNLDSGRYWEIVITAHGDIFDALCQKHFDRSYSDVRAVENVAGLQSATSIVEPSGDWPGGFRVEMAIPWAQLPEMPLPVKPGTRLHGLLAIADRQTPEPDGVVHFYAHTPMLASFHNIWGYSPIVLDA